MTPPTVCAIGSCRIMEPLDMLIGMNAFSSGYAKAAWYTHSTFDTLQKIDILTGRLIVPEDRIGWITNNPERFFPQAYGHGFLDNVDLFVIEICSLKGLHYDGLEVHQWCLRDLLANAGIDSARFHEEASKPEGSRDLTFLPPDTPAPLIDLAARGVFERQDTTAIKKGLKQIVETLQKPIIFVPPIHVETPEGVLIPEREVLTTAIESHASENGCGFFNPAPIIRGFGRHEALKDMGHYTDPFKGVLAGHMLNALLPFGL